MSLLNNTSLSIVALFAANSQRVRNDEKAMTSEGNSELLPAKADRFCK